MSSVLIEGLYSIYPRANGQVRILHKQLNNLTAGTVIVLDSVRETEIIREAKILLRHRHEIFFIPLNGSDADMNRFAMPDELHTHSWFTGAIVGAGWTAESVWGALAQLSEPVQLALGLIEDERGEKPATSRFRGEQNA